MSALLLTHVAATWIMTGIIWFVQVVHYPLMSDVGREGFTRYERRHTRRTSWVVAPPMLVEAGTAVALAVLPHRVIPSIQAWAGLGLVALIWLSTAVLQVPRHRVLERGFDAAAHRVLVGTNWIRVVLWTLRALLAAWWLVQFNSQIFQFSAAA